MDIVELWDNKNLILFIAFVIPGFIAIKTYQLVIPTAKANPGDLLVDAITYSCINYAVSSWLIVIVINNQLSVTCPAGFVTFITFELLILPIFLALGYSKIRQLPLFARHLGHPIDKAWDYIFNKKESYWVVVSFRDGTKVGGRYDTKSFASSGTDDEQLYLEEQWTIDKNDKFIAPHVRSCGVLILSSQVNSIEFIGG